VTFKKKKSKSGTAVPESEEERPVSEKNEGSPNENKSTSSPIYVNFTPRSQIGRAGQLWKYYWREKNRRTAKCKICGTIYQIQNGTTSSLWRHLAAAHPKIKTKK